MPKVTITWCGLRAWRRAVRREATALAMGDSLWWWTFENEPTHLFVRLLGVELLVVLP